MDKLRKYINALSKRDAEDFAIRLGTTIGYLRRAISGGVLLGEKLCTSIEVESLGEVTRKDLRPDDWRLIWLELAEKEAT